MILNPEALDLAFKGFKAVYSDAYTKAPVAWDKIAMTVPRSARDETYGWLGQFPQLREWVSGERELKALEAFGFPGRCPLRRLQEDRPSCPSGPSSRRHQRKGKARP